MVNGVGQGNAAELLALFSQGGTETAQTASMDVLKKALEVTAAESASLIDQIAAATGQGGQLNVYA